MDTSANPHGGYGGFGPPTALIFSSGSHERINRVEPQTLHTLHGPAAAVLEECRRRDIAIVAQDDMLKYDAPIGAMTDGLRSALAKHKAALLDLLDPERVRAIARDAPAPACEAGSAPAPPGPAASEWSAALARLRAGADADGIVRDDPAELFNVLADAGADRGVTPAAPARGHGPELTRPRGWSTRR